MVGRPSTAAAELREPLLEYLNERHAVYLEQPEFERKPTLPTTPGGKVNLSAIAGAVKHRFPEIEKSEAVVRKDLYRDELISEINLIAEQQGLCCAAEGRSEGDVEVQRRLAQQAKTSSANGLAAVTAKAAEAKLREELSAAYVDNERLRARIDALTLQLDLFRSGVAVRGLE